MGVCIDALINRSCYISISRFDTVMAIIDGWRAKVITEFFGASTSDIDGNYPFSITKKYW